MRVGRGVITWRRERMGGTGGDVFIDHPDTAIKKWVPLMDNQLEEFDQPQ
jgi:hypothetical protein